MFVKDEFSKREKIAEDLSGIFRKLEMSPDAVACVGSIISCNIPLDDMLNPKKLGKIITDTVGYPYKVNSYPFGEKTSEIYPSFIATCN